MSENSNMSVHYSSKSDNWETPVHLFNQLDEIYHFDVDLAAADDNALCKTYFTKENDALTKDWGQYKSIFCNPPYSRGSQGEFVKKAYETVYDLVNNTKIVLLLPARLETRIWADYCSKASEIIFIIGRLKFINKSFPSYRADGNYKLNSAPFPSALVIFDKEQKEQRISWKKFRIDYEK
jgi:site-specific DNA-methyltransferase (adenine-specific)